jgi:hypothetical protein
MPVPSETKKTVRVCMVGGLVLRRAEAGGAYNPAHYRECASAVPQSQCLLSCTPPRPEQKERLRRVVCMLPRF